MWTAIGQAFSMVFEPYTLMVMVFASLYGLFVGSVPGLTATMATALLVPVTFFGLFGAFRFLAKKDIAGHRKTMRHLYVGACVVAGLFTLSPHRLLGQLVWGQWLGLV